MPEPTSDAWTQIRYDYEHTNRPIEDICAEHGISSGTLRDRVRRWRWTRRRAPIPPEGPPAIARIEPTPWQDIEARSPWPLGPRLHGDERGEVAQAMQVSGLDAITPTPAPSPQGGGVQSEPAPPVAPGHNANAPAGGDPASIAPRLQSAVARVLPAIETIIARLAAGPRHPREMEQTARTLGTLTRTLRELNALLSQHPVRAAASDDDDMPDDIDAFRIDLARRINAFVASRSGETDRGETAETAQPPEAG